MNLGLLRPGRFVVAHVGAVLVRARGRPRHRSFARRSGGGGSPGPPRTRRLSRRASACGATPSSGATGNSSRTCRSRSTSPRSTRTPSRSTSAPRSSTCSATRSTSGRTNPLLFEKIVHPLDSERVLRAIAMAKAEMNPYEAEYRLYHKNGTVIWVQDRAVTVRDTRGGRFHWQGFLVDVTARKQAEARYRTLVEQLPLITYIDTPYSEDEAASYVSPQIEEILGYSLEEWHANPSFFVEHLHPEDRERVREAQREARMSARAARARVPVHRGRRPRRLAERQLHGRSRRDRQAVVHAGLRHRRDGRASRQSGTARRCSRRRRSRTNGYASSTG